MQHTSPSSTPQKKCIANYIDIYRDGAAPFLPPRSPVSSFGSMQTQHARQTKVCKGKQVLLSLGTLLPAFLSSHHHHAMVHGELLQALARVPAESSRCMQIDAWIDDAVCTCLLMPRALESQPAQVGIHPT